MIKLLELFGGIGAPRKALMNLGVKFESVGYVENDINAVKSYNAIFNEKENVKSVVGYIPTNCDILFHGSPCQDFSIAGLQKGGRIEDESRSSLLFETIKIINRMNIKPKIVIWENVKNVLSESMSSALDDYLISMELLGYVNSYEVLNSFDFGIPQKRERIFVVSVFEGNKFDFRLMDRNEKKPIGMFLEKDVNERYTITQASMIKKIGVKHNFGLKVIDDFVSTITTKQLRCPNSGIVELDNGYRLLTEKECWRFMGFDDDDFYKALAANPRRKNFMSSILYKQAGNSVVVDILESMFCVIIKYYFIE